MTTPTPTAARWPVWDLVSGDYRALAAYASTRALDRLDLSEAGGRERLVASDDRRPAARALVARLYERLVAKDYHYNIEEWHRVAHQQRIRDPRAIDRGAGTCLDLALLFCAMCKDSDLRPYLALLVAPPDADGRGGSSHAMVVVDLDGSAGDPTEPPPPLGAYPDGRQVFRLHQAERWDTERVAPGPELGERYVAIDVTGACHVRGWCADQASAVGAAALRGDEVSIGSEDVLLGRDYPLVHLVDIVGCHWDDIEELLPQRDVNRPSIYRQLPPAPEFRHYPSRAARLDELRNATGFVPLLGVSGSGKSMLAHRVASLADEGCGWFLNASGPDELVNALADAEAYETGSSTRGLPAADLEALATAALTRLRDAEGRWVVVLDNADGAPADIADWLPTPSDRRRQLVLLTTTNPAWRGRSPDTVVLPPLTDDEVVTDLGPDAPVEAIAGRPLLVDASRRYRETVGSWWWEDEEPDEAARTVADAPLRLWTVARKHIRAPVDQRVVESLCWLPPGGTPISVLAPLASAVARPQDVDASCGRLSRLGLAEKPGDTVVVHRLLRTAMRDGLVAEDPAGQATVVMGLLEQPIVMDVFQATYDKQSVDAMEALLTTAIDVMRFPSAMNGLAALVERHHVDRAALWYRRILAALDWSTERDFVGRERGLVVDSLRGMARQQMRSGERDVEEAIAWTEEAERRARAGTTRNDRIAAARVSAMRGLLLRKRAGTHRDDAVAENRDLNAASELLRASVEERRTLFAGEDSPDVDRSEYNVAGTEIRLAQTDVPERALEHVTEAREGFDGARKARIARYGTTELEEVVCCVNGLALADYYEAVLCPAPSDWKFQLLRRATVHATEAVAVRQRLAGGNDSPDTSKSLGLLVKIAAARALLAQAIDRHSEDLARAISQFERKERGRLLSTVVDEIGTAEGEQS